MELKHDIAGLEDIVLFVNNFYTRVQEDELIGPVFNGVISNWQPHLDRMYSFWNAVLFGVPGFKGNPFARHAPLAIETRHFDRWLSLFNQTIDAHFSGEIAELTKVKAQLMAALFLSKLQNMKGGAGRVIV